MEGCARTAAPSTHAQSMEDAVDGPVTAQRAICVAECVLHRPICSWECVVCRPCALSRACILSRMSACLTLYASGLCECFDGWQGNDCSEPIVPAECDGEFAGTVRACSLWQEITCCDILSPLHTSSGPGCEACTGDTYGGLCKDRCTVDSCSKHGRCRGWTGDSAAGDLRCRMCSLWAICSWECVLCRPCAL